VIELGHNKGFQLVYAGGCIVLHSVGLKALSTSGVESRAGIGLKGEFKKRYLCIYIKCSMAIHNMGCLRLPNDLMNKPFALVLRSGGLALK
jgi:hypothetical protein